MISRRLFGGLAAGGALFGKSIAHDVVQSTSLSKHRITPPAGWDPFGVQANAEVEITTPSPAPLMSHESAMKLLMQSESVRKEMESYLFSTLSFPFEMIDPDIQVKRSWSPMYKSLVQRQRNVAAQMDRWTRSAQRGRSIDGLWDWVEVRIRKMMWGEAR